jgi:hypothetical protein
MRCVNISLFFFFNFGSNCCTFVLLGPTRDDMLVALEIITDYLTVAQSERIVTALGLVTTSELSARASSAASSSMKRKADWEQELEVSLLVCCSLLQFAVVCCCGKRSCVFTFICMFCLFLCYFFVFLFMCILLILYSLLYVAKS